MISTADLVKFRDETFRAKSLSPSASSDVAIAFNSRIKLLDDLIAMSVLSDREAKSLSDIPENVIRFSPTIKSKPKEAQ